MSNIKILEDSSFLASSIIINVVLFTLLAELFTIKVLPSNYKNTVNVIIENSPPIPKPIKEEVHLKKFTIKRNYAAPKKLMPVKGNNKVLGHHYERSTFLHQNELAQKGDIKIPPPKNDQIKRKVNDVSVLSSIEENILKKAKDQKAPVAGDTKQVGNISAMIGTNSSHVSEGSRRIIYLPPPPHIRSGEFPAPMLLRVYVSPSGFVERVVILRRSGSPVVDSEVVSYVKRFRFEPINGPTEVGTITINFRGG